jgi:hypothetical protein
VNKQILVTQKNQKVVEQQQDISMEAITTRKTGICDGQKPSLQGKR